MNSVFLGNIKGVQGNDGQRGERGAKGDAGENGRGFTARGNWDSSATYTATNTNIDVVLYRGQAYYCKRTNTDKSPATETSYWGLFTESGGVEIIRL